LVVKVSNYSETDFYRMNRLVLESKLLRDSFDVQYFKIVSRNLPNFLKIIPNPSDGLRLFFRLLSFRPEVVYLMEPVIGHIKHDHGMLRNYLSGTQGDAINTLLAAAGFNMMKMLRRIKAKIIRFCFRLLYALENYINPNITNWEPQWVFQV